MASLSAGRLSLAERLTQTWLADHRYPTYKDKLTPVREFLCPVIQGKVTTRFISHISHKFPNIKTMVFHCSIMLLILKIVRESQITRFMG